LRRPLIGITVGKEKDEYRSYAKAVEDAGGRAEFLEITQASEDELFALVGRLDGLLLSGGIDIHPDYYDSRNEPGDELLSDEELIAAYRMDCDPERDDFEIPLTQTAYEAQLPILGICRGFQTLNVALGGSLIKDIRTGLKHWKIREDEQGEGPEGQSRKHLAVIESQSKLASILGDCPLLVNSRHHQGIMDRHRAGRLKATAFAPDGIIEGIEGIDHPWALAVQWHPERTQDSYIHEPCRKLFEAFISAASRQ